MQKKLTITLDERVYDGLHTVIGRRRISQFIESLVRPHVLDKDLEAAYQQMAQDEARETEATFRAVPITNPDVVQSVVEKFRQKYGAGDVKRYYSKFDVAVEAVS